MVVTHPDFYYHLTTIDGINLPHFAVFCFFRDRVTVYSPAGSIPRRLRRIRIENVFAFGSIPSRNFPRKNFSRAIPNMPTFRFYVRINGQRPRFMRRFPAFSFRAGEIEESCGEKRIPPHKKYGKNIFHRKTTVFIVISFAKQTKWVYIISWLNSILFDFLLKIYITILVVLFELNESDLGDSEPCI